MKQQIQKGNKVRLHQGKTTRSPVFDSSVYQVVAVPNKKFDFFTIIDYYRGGNVYNVSGSRLSLIKE